MAGTVESYREVGSTDSCFALHLLRPAAARPGGSAARASKLNG